MDFSVIDLGTPDLGTPELGKTSETLASHPIAKLTMQVVNTCLTLRGREIFLNGIPKAETIHEKTKAHVRIK